MGYMMRAWKPIESKVRDEALGRFRHHSRPHTGRSRRDRGPQRGLHEGRAPARRRRAALLSGRRRHRDPARLVRKAGRGADRVEESRGEVLPAVR